MRRDYASEIKRALAFACVLILFTMIVGGILQGIMSAGDKSFEDTQSELFDCSEMLSVSSVESTELLSLCTVPLNEDNVMDYDPTVSRVITATVTSPIENPLLGWTIEDSDGNEVTELTVTAVSDDTYTAVITCNAAFEGSYYVKATIRGLTTSANAVVYYTGIPTELVMDDIEVAYYNNLYHFPFAFDNPFGAVHVPEDYDFEIVSINAAGYVITANFFVDGAGVYHQESSETTVPFYTFSNAVANNQMFFSIVGTNFYVRQPTPLSTWYVSRTLFTDTTMRYVSLFVRELVRCFFVITVRENVTGLEATFRVFPFAGDSPIVN